MSKKINDLICDHCRASTYKGLKNKEWYIEERGNKILCPVCTRREILKLIDRSIDLFPTIRIGLLLNLLGLQDEIDHLPDSVILKHVKNKIKYLQNQ